MSVDPVAPPASAWDPLLDQLEHRLRLLEASVRPRPGAPVDVGPAVGPADIPTVAPTLEERMRLLALVSAHDHAIERLQRRRRSLRQAQHYRMGAV
jgi:hypothetical protein